MTRKETKFYKKLLENNNDRYKIYKKLFKIINNDYNFLRKDVAKLYIEHNKKNLYELNDIKQKLLGGKYKKIKDNSTYNNELKNILEKVYKLTGGDLSDIVAALGSVSSTLPEASSDSAQASAPDSAQASAPDSATASASASNGNILTDPAAVEAAITKEINLLKSKLDEYITINNKKPGLLDLIKTINKVIDSGKSADVIKNELENVWKSLKNGQEQTKNQMNSIIAGFFEQFAENTPKWMFVQEYSKDFESFIELQNLMKIESRESASDEKLEYDIAIAFAKLGSLFTPTAPGALANSPFNPTTREKSLARGALDRSGLVLPDMGPTTTGNPKISGGAEPPAPAKSDEEKEKEAAKAAKEQNEMISQVKKDTNEILGILGQIQSRYKKTYSYEADDIDSQDKFADSKENELKRILTNGDLSNDERSLVSKWASIKEEQKWITDLEPQIKKAKELYDNAQKSITKLASVPNDPELAEILRSLTLLNDGNLDPQTPFEKDSLPNHLSKLLTEITSAYQVVVKGYNNAGESVTKRSQQTSSSSSSQNSDNPAINEANKTINRLKQKLTKLQNLIIRNQEIIEANKEIEDKAFKDSSDTFKKDWLNDEISAEIYDSNLIGKSGFTNSKKIKIKGHKKEFISNLLNYLAYQVQRSIDPQYYADVNKYLESISSAADTIPNEPTEITLPTSDKNTHDKGNNTIDKHISDISEAINQKIIRAMIKPIEMKLKTRLSPEYGILADNPTLLDDIYNRYQKSKASEGNLISAINLENLLNANDLIPSEVLKITSFDKMIFAFIIIIFRLIAVTIAEYMIEKDWLLSLGYGIIAFGVIYTLLFITFVVVVNFDLWRLRILFNYVNMHVNTSIILIHLAMVWGLLSVVLILIFNINFNITGLSTKITSEEDKARLQYRLEMITLILWVLLLLLVAVF